MKQFNLPNNWSIKKLGDIFTLSAGGDVDKSLLSKKQDAQHPYPIYANALTDRGLYGYSSNYRVEQESITITGRGDIGKVFYRAGKYTPIVRLVVGVPKEGISAKYMSYACSKIRFFNETTGVPQLTVPQVAGYKVAVPPLSEQKKIARILSCWDTAIEQMQNLISEKKELKRGLMQQLLTGKMRLPMFVKPWKTKPIKDIAEIFTANSKSQYINDAGQYLIVDMGAVSNDATLIAKKKTDYAKDFLYNGDIIMPKDDIGGCNIIGKTVVVPVDNKYIMGDHVFKLVVSSNDGRFISYLINSYGVNKHMRRMTTGSAQLSLAKRDVEKTTLLLPSDIKEQKTIADILMSADSEIDLLNKKLDVLKEQKKGLMQKLLTGEIRVKVDKNGIS